MLFFFKGSDIANPALFLKKILLRQETILKLQWCYKRSYFAFIILWCPLKLLMFQWEGSLGVWQALNIDDFLRHGGVHIFFPFLVNFDFNSPRFLTIRRRDIAFRKNNPLQTPPETPATYISSWNDGKAIHNNAKIFYLQIFCVWFLLLCIIK